MAVHDTEENGRTELTKRTIHGLLKTVNFDRHRLIIVDNGSCDETKKILDEVVKYGIGVITIPKNIGTAAGLNLAWKERNPEEHCIKMDNDVIIHQVDWVEQMEEAIKRQPLIGQVGLKRKDCWEYPGHENPELRSKLHMLPHKAGEKWIIVEQAKHIMGTCVMHSSALLDKVGYLYQPGLYGYDDVLMSWRANLAGFICCFLPHIDIDHIDPGATEYTDWKSRYAGQYAKIVSDIVDEYIAGTKPLYYEG
jgi:GT2 family glycosyltransferase